MREPGREGRLGGGEVSSTLLTQRQVQSVLNMLILTDRSGVTAGYRESTESTTVRGAWNLSAVSQQMSTSVRLETGSGLLLATA